MIAAMPIDPELLRTVMRHWPTGVTILTARHAGAAHGMTVNSFSSVALDPPLVLASIEQIVRTHELIEQSGAFGLSFLREGQEWISNRFAGRDTENQDRFAGLSTFTAVTGAPILADNIGYLDCVVVAAHPAGNHTIFIGQVVAASPGTAGPVVGDDPRSGDGAAADDNGAPPAVRPLLYFNRDYRRMA
jgi:flavin reductase (DIM6/NTAB) family NADH-FMN oxidoreductase RutF